MSREQLPEIDDEPLLEDEQPEDAVETEERFAWLRNMPCFALSALLHLILVLLLINIVYEQGKKKETEVPIVVGVAQAKKPPPPAYDPTLKRDVKKTPKLPGQKSVTDKPFVSKKEVELDQVAAEMPQGTSLEHVSNFNTDFSDSSNQAGTNISMGVGAGVAGAYGERWGKGSLITEGGNPGTEDAVRAALEWLKRHQSEDGSWKAAQYISRCKKTCANVDAARHPNEGGFEYLDVGVTGLAILAFAGYGQTHRDGTIDEFVACLRKAVAYLKRVQVHSEDPSTDGMFGTNDKEQWIYSHAIATMAMCELYVMSNDTLGLKKSVSAAVKLCLRAQNDGRGWRYGIKPGDNDTSVTGWMVLALKTAKNANLGIPKEEFHRAFSGAITWFNAATSATGKTGYMAPGDEGSRLANIFPDPYPYSKDLSCMTAVAVLCRLFAGESRSSPVILNGVKVLMAHTPQWQEQKGRALSTINIYYWYYGSYALFQYGGEPWKKWNQDMIKALISTQRQGIICEDGSWDPIDEWGAAGGRVYSTALGAMTLEVYYRFTRATSGVGL